MTDVAVEEPEVAEEATPVPTPVDLIPDLKTLFTFSAWVHVGTAADVCEKVDTEAGTNECDDPEHIHAWCRLPNGLQLRVIAEKARAAKARRSRELRNSETDSHAILEDELADLLEGDPEGLVDVLIGRDWYQNYTRARGEVEAMEPDREDDDEGPFAHIDDDQIRLLEILAMPEDEQPEDERETLDKHIKRWQDLVDQKLGEITDPVRQSLMALDLGSLTEKVRRTLIQQDSMGVFQHEYALNEWLLCTMRAPRGTRLWMTTGDMESEPPELIDAVKETYERLERDQRGLAQGKAS